jgi:transposase InsO family protein
MRQSVQNINDCWSMDFASDGLFNARRFRVLSVVDIFSRECLGIEVNQGIRGQDVVTLLDQIKSVRGNPMTFSPKAGTKTGGRSCLRSDNHGLAIQN